MMRRNGGGGFNRRFVPVKVGEEIDVRIEAQGKKGDGIATKQGFVLFVPNTNAGDQVRVKVSRVLNKVGFADVIGDAQGQVVNPEGETRPPRQDQQEEYAESASEDQGEDAHPESEDFGDSEDFGEDRKE